MKSSIIKFATILTVSILFACFMIMLGVGFALLATVAVVRFVYYLLEK